MCNKVLMIMFISLFSIASYASFNICMDDDYETYFTDGCMRFVWKKNVNYKKKSRTRYGCHIEEILPLGLDYMYLAYGFVPCDRGLVKMHVLFLVLYDGTIQERALWFDFGKNKMKTTILSRKVLRYSVKESKGGSKRILYVYTDVATQSVNYEYMEEEFKFDVVNGGKIGSLSILFLVPYQL